MFTDIVGSTALIQAVGDGAWNDVREWHNRVLRASFAAHRGEEVDHSGDGFFVAFAGAGEALACAIGMQRLLAEHRRTHGFAPRVRIGLHADRASRTDDTYAGRAVHEAARVGALAEGDQILVTAATLAAAGGGDWRVAETRDVQLKGIAESVRVVSIDWREAVPAASLAGAAPQD
jgi:class 3 adenylate cyclase